MTAYPNYIVIQNILSVLPEGISLMKSDRNEGNWEQF